MDSSTCSGAILSRLYGGDANEIIAVVLFKILSRLYGGDAKKD